MASRLNRQVLPLSWYQVCRMFERASWQLLIESIDRSLDTAQKPLGIGCGVEKGALTRFWNTTRIQWITTWNIFETSPRSIFKTFLLLFHLLSSSRSFDLNRTIYPRLYIRFHWLTIRDGYITMIMPNQWRRGMHYSFQLRPTSSRCLILIIPFFPHSFSSFSSFRSLSSLHTHTHTRIASGYISGSLSHIYSHYRRCFVQICLLEILQASSAENIESDEYFMICRAFPALQPCGAITIIYKSIDWRKKGGGGEGEVYR